MIVFSVVSTKGGVGKTTLTANLGALLADCGLNVLLINADYQASLNEFFHLKHRAPNGLTAMVMSRSLTDSMISVVELPSPLSDDNRVRRMKPPAGKLHLVLTDAGQELESWLDSRMDYYQHLRQATRNPVVADRYDVILIDTQGSAGKLQDAAVVAADKMIHPVPPDTLSAREFLTATADLIDRISTVCPQPPNIYAVLYKQTRTNNARKIAADIREHYIRLRGTVTVAQTVIPHATVFERSATEKTPVHWLDPDHAGVLMQDLMNELIPVPSPNVGDTGNAGDSEPAGLT